MLESAGGNQWEYIVITSGSQDVGLSHLLGLFAILESII